MNLTNMTTGNLIFYGRIMCPGQHGLVMISSPSVFYIRQQILGNSTHKDWTVIITLRLTGFPWWCLQQSINWHIYELEGGKRLPFFTQLLHSLKHSTFNNNNNIPSVECRQTLPLPKLERLFPGNTTHLTILWNPIGTLSAEKERENTSLNNFMKSNVQVRWYRNEDWESMVPNSFEDSPIMSSNGQARFVRIVTYIKYVNDRINWARCNVQTIRWPSLVYKSRVCITAFLFPSKGMNRCLPRPKVKQAKLFR